MNGVLMTILVIISAISLGLVVLSLYKVRKVYRDIVKFITPQAENQPSPIAQIAFSLMHEMGASAAMEIKTTLLGKSSGESRAEQAVMTEMVQGAVSSQSPMLGAALESFPKLRKMVGKHPELLFAVQSALSKLGGGGGNGSANPAVGQASGTVDSPYKF